MSNFWRIPIRGRIIQQTTRETVFKTRKLENKIGNLWIGGVLLPDGVHGDPPSCLAVGVRVRWLAGSQVE
ncbi:hypothetical protein AKJ47_02660 [candidate division MSBL1 archaeon SCGC-AAA261G05]|uniref:Uncharacterized protein n=2 Tax=candidate division MSBL1 TaxID=215777 RepID=A0A133V9V9_9EURY|nr:hypothetical protein AKJ47_02660 [candidate division MSBL1 archaeon SCGC-AAA261G05]KXB04086.1 hypothetical protein AKJ48_03390 [candidate division MSBL1 archaeon SCGC-AAA261O19]